MASTIENKLDTTRDPSRKPVSAAADDTFGDSHAIDLWAPLHAALRPLASLKLSVVLFGLAIAIVLAGTFAQAHMPLDDAIGRFFRIRPSELVQETFPWFRVDRLFAWVPINTFLVPAFGFEEPPLSNKIGFLLPKGWTVGLVMMLNLLAAHIVRFRVQSDGMRLAGGLGVMGLGVLITAIVVMSGQSADGLQETPIISYDTLWLMLQVGLFTASLTAFYAAYTKKSLALVKRGILIGLGALSAACCAWTLLGGDAAQLADANMRILYQLLKGMLAGLVLLGGAWLAFGKRAGIVVIHLGVGLLMASEVFVGLKAVESQMVIGEGETNNFLMDISSVELAVIDHDHPDHPGEDVVTVIPQSMLDEGAVIDDERFPFLIQVDEFFPNVEFVPPTENNPATQGLGSDIRWIPMARGVEAQEKDRIVGTDSEADIPSAYVTLKDREEPQDAIGTWLLSVVFDVPASRERFPDLTFAPQFVSLAADDPGRWEISLRHRRTYVPFEFTLHDIEVDHYVGSRQEKSYEALVRVSNASDEFERDNVKIWMNNPLRYAGYTFYQSGYAADGISRLETTTLQVVSNQGWMLPYLCCMIVLVGLSWQFGTSLVRFIDRRTRQSALTAQMKPIEPERRTMPVDDHLTRNERRHREKMQVVATMPRQSDAFESLFPWIMGMMAVGFLTVTVFLSLVHAPREHEFNLALFGRLPVADGGRIQPIDSLARNTLMAVSDVQRFELGGNVIAEKRSAVEWFMEVAANTPRHRNLRVFRIDNDELLQRLGLTHREGLRYSLEEFSERIPDLADEHAVANEMARDKQAVLTTFQRALVEFGERIEAFQRLQGGFEFPEPEPVPGKDPLEVLRDQVASIDASAPKAVPIVDPVSGRADWTPYSLLDFQAQVIGRPGNSEYFQLMHQALNAYEQKDAQTFNDAVTQMHHLAGTLEIEGYSPFAVGFEAFYNGLAPFFSAWILSIAAFLLVAASWLFWNEPLRKSALIVMTIALGVITFAMIARMYISGRPPVTNLYSSAAFIAGVGVVFGLAFEGVFRNSMGVAVASLAGLLSLKVSHALALDGDTFNVLQPVLDTQFWLATHVVTITMGYATTYVAGLFGVMYLLTGFAADLFPDRFSPVKLGELQKNLVRMMYGTLCFALLFSFVGTVLGGLWADDSWGRFWGWDPKENGALIIVLWNALVLHARWDRIVRDRGLAALCVLGNITVSWSWFGTNALGIGLHAYGFKEGTILWLSGFVVSQILIAGLALRKTSSPSLT